MHTRLAKLGIEKMDPDDLTEEERSRCGFPQRIACGFTLNKPHVNAVIQSDEGRWVMRHISGPANTDPLKPASRALNCLQIPFKAKPLMSPSQICPAGH